MNVKYCTRESVKSVLDFAETSRANKRIDNVIESSARSIEGSFSRIFYPLTATRRFDWPTAFTGPSTYPWSLPLRQYELASVTSLVAGGVTIPPTDYFLEPVNSGPPYNYVNINLGSNSAFQSGTTYQQAIVITGVYAGCAINETQVGVLSGNLAAPAGSTANVTWTTSDYGVGSILRIDSERMIISARNYVDSSQHISVALNPLDSNNQISVQDGTAFGIDEVITIDTERMRIDDIIGNNLTVKRAFDGTVLNAHAQNAEVFTLTGVQLDRGALGTTATAHITAAPIYLFQVPEGIRDLNCAMAEDQLLQGRSGWARVVNAGAPVPSGGAGVRTGGKQMANARGTALDRLKDDMRWQYARNLRGPFTV